MGDDPHHAVTGEVRAWVEDVVAEATTPLCTVVGSWGERKPRIPRVEYRTLHAGLWAGMGWRLGRNQMPTGRTAFSFLMMPGRTSKARLISASVV